MCHNEVHVALNSAYTVCTGNIATLLLLHSGSTAASYCYLRNWSYIFLMRSDAVAITIWLRVQHRLACRQPGPPVPCNYHQQSQINTSHKALSLAIITHIFRYTLISLLTSLKPSMFTAFNEPGKHILMSKRQSKVAEQIREYLQQKSKLSRKVSNTIQSNVIKI